MKLGRNQKRFIVSQTILLFLLVSLFWLLDVSVSVIGSGQVRTLFYTLDAIDTYHIALIGLVFVYFVSFFYFLNLLEEDTKE